MGKGHLRMIAAVMAAMFIGLVYSSAALAAEEGSGLPEGAVLINGGYADVTGDGIVDEVILYGKRAQADADFMSEHGILLTDGKDGKQLQLSLGPESAGYPGQMDFGRLNPGQSVDLLLQFASGGSGGVTTVMPVTLEGGALKSLADIYLMNDGPKVELIVNDKYKMTAKYEGIEYAIDLLNGASSDTEGVYKGIFDETGRKVGTLKPVIDPVGASELADLNGDGIFEIVTYRSIWAVVHTNGIAYARSTWGWDEDAIKPRFTSIKQRYTPGDYLDFINSLSDKEMISAMKMVTAKYVSGFESAPPAWRYEAFLVFRAYQSAIAEKVSQGFPSTATADEATMQKVYQQIDALAEVGIGAFYAGQGKIAALPDPLFQIAKFEKYVPKEAVEFLLIDAVEVYDIWVLDGALTIQMEELGNRLHDWEYFLQMYPNSPFTQYATGQYVSKLAAFLVGTDNSLNFNPSDGTVNPGVMASFEKYIREFDGSASAAVVADALAIMREGKGKLNQAMIDRILDLLPKPVSTEKVDN